MLMFMQHPLIVRSTGGWGIVEELTDLCVNIMYRQYLKVNKLDESTPFDTLKYDKAHSTPLIGHLIRLLRMAVIMKYVIQYSEMTNSMIV